MLEYNGIELVPIEIDDLKVLNKWKNDEEVFKYLGGGYRPTSMSQQRNWIEKLVENTLENQRYIILSEEKEKIGFIGLYGISAIHRTCDLGIYIGEKENRGKGVATRAYKALEKYAKEYLNIRKIRLEVVKENEAAVKLYQKLDFNVCGEYKQERFIQGEYKDILLMEKFI